MRCLALLLVFVPTLVACAEDEGRDNPLFTTSTTNNSAGVETGDEMGDEDADGDPGAGDGDGDGDGDGGDGDGDGGDGDGDGDAVCGNGIREFGEECDESDLNGLDCTDFGFDNGMLVCAMDCTLFTNACSTCGDGQLAANELCDGNNFGGQTCEGLGYAGGSLACAPDCSAIIQTGCTQSADCGNGLIDGAEECDGGNLNGQTCQSLGFDGGSLSCTAGCLLNTGSCSVNQCVQLLGACNLFLNDCCAGLLCAPLFGCVPE